MVQAMRDLPENSTNSFHACRQRSADRAGAAQDVQPEQARREGGAARLRGGAQVAQLARLRPGAELHLAQTHTGLLIAFRRHSCAERRMHLLRSSSGSTGPTLSRCRTPYALLTIMCVGRDCKEGPGGVQVSRSARRYPSAGALESPGTHQLAGPHMQDTPCSGSVCC